MNKSNLYFSNTLLLLRDDTVKSVAFQSNTSDMLKHTNPPSKTNSINFNANPPAFPMLFRLRLTASTKTI